MGDEDQPIYEWDDAKSEQTRQRRGFGFEIMREVHWEYALCVELQDVNGEEREKWLAPIGEHLFVTVITPREGAIRVISLRRATQNEIALWRREIGT